MLTALYVAVFVDYAWAYLDPGSGSFILQVVIGVILSSLFAIKTFWKGAWLKITGIFRRKDDGAAKEDDSSDYVV